MTLTPDILNAAIEGFEQQKLRIDNQIADLRAMLNGDAGQSSSEGESVKPRRKFSAATKQRMREAQQRRWDNKRSTAASQDTGATKSKGKRKLSAAGRAAIVEALKKRWAAKKAANAKPAANGKPATRKSATKKAA